MASIDLPRDLKDYFSFAEMAATRNGRRFSITLPYLRDDGRLDRLQWWYHLSATRELVVGDSAVDTLRNEAVSRFQAHIDQWLQNTGQVLYGSGAIPQLSKQGPRVAVRPHAPEPPADETTTEAAAQPGHILVVEDTPDQPHAIVAPPGKTAFG